MAILQEWLHNCLEKHSGWCSPVRGNQLPGFRLLDCRSRCLVNAPADCKYVALSYLWGQDHDGAFHVSALPRTIEDGITVTLLMGYHFLWIDRYCIDQNDPEQKHDQISNMDQVFSGADLVIIAAAGEDPHYGLPGISTRARKHQRTIETESFKLVQMFPYAKEVLSRTRWATRAWTFQEGYLAKRRLIFTDHQAIFVCGEGYCTETLSSPIAHYACQPDLNLAGYFLARDTIYPDRCIEEYTARFMSFESDALDAFQGVLNYWSDSTKIQGVPRNIFVGSQHHAHIWGVTTNGSWLNLGWWHKRTTRKRRGFPSWSWTGWHGSVKFGNSTYKQFLPRIKVGHHRVSPPIPESMSKRKAQSSHSVSWIPLQFYVDDFHKKYSARHDTLQLLKISGPCPRLRILRKSHFEWSALIPATSPGRSISCKIAWDIDWDEEDNCDFNSCVAMMIEGDSLPIKPATSAQAQTGTITIQSSRSGRNDKIRGWFLLMLPMPTGGTYERVGKMWADEEKSLRSDKVSTESETWEEPLWSERTIVLA
ncbi:heterokaryon incompatibility protein-domain-containing protein [Paraphoma chrysanthemicola]|uniref:Heterokaryon incompatibility protein-domain-containing protein n=1 Tax=Paraphoma chrysanthemicola TaxID=798071 RepID=A0A8K0R5M3_9PLEO|nr:heterokaryon incompatibility protein-domain-containing protein [Paraphoma chrysanthemicola]